MSLEEEVDQFFLLVMGIIVVFIFQFGQPQNVVVLGNAFIAIHVCDLPATKYAAFFFQYTFAATAATIISGAVAERCELIAYFAYSFFITGLFDSSQTLDDSPAYNDTNNVDPDLDADISPAELAALGAFILICGFLAFNGGALGQLSAPGSGATIALCIVNTVISGTFSAFTSLIVNRIKLFGTAKWSLLVTINGALTGMVAICSGVNAVETWSAAIVGSLSGIVYHLSSKAMLKLHIDDPLDAVAVHLGGGIWGVLAVAFIHSKEGILYNWNRRSGLILAWQIGGVTLIIAWTAVTSLALFGGLKLLKMLRVSEEMEIKGLDIPKHDEPAYPLEAYGYQHLLDMSDVQETDNLKQDQSNGGPETVSTNIDL